MRVPMGQGSVKGEKRVFADDCRALCSAGPVIGAGTTPVSLINLPCRDDLLAFCFILPNHLVR